MRIGRPQDYLQTNIIAYNDTHVFGQMEGETSPTASKIDNAHTVFDTRVFAVLFKHGNFRFLKSGVWIGPPSRRIFFAWSKAQIIKFGGDLVVLLVGFVGSNGNRHRLEFVDNFEFLFELKLG